MRIRMLVTRRGSPDGIHAVEYHAGEAYDLPPALAEPWLAKGYCEQDKMLVGPAETKEMLEKSSPAEGERKPRRKRG